MLPVTIVGWRRAAHASAAPRARRCMRCAPRAPGRDRVPAARSLCAGGGAECGRRGGWCRGGVAGAPWHEVGEPRTFPAECVSRPSLHVAVSRWQASQASYLGGGCFTFLLHALCGLWSSQSSEGWCSIASSAGSGSGGSACLGPVDWHSNNTENLERCVCCSTSLINRHAT